jgi:hypothetical protein
MLYAAQEYRSIGIQEYSKALVWAKKGMELREAVRGMGRTDTGWIK